MTTALKISLNITNFRPYEMKNKDLVTYLYMEQCKSFISLHYGILDVHFCSRVPFSSIFSKYKVKIIRFWECFFLVI